MGLDTGINRADGSEVIYWRKANAIHRWFVDNIQDGSDECEDHEVTADQLRELKDICLKVVQNPILADELLPTRSGFFFGSTEYDEWYHDEILRTYEYLSDLLSEAPEDEVFTYWSSW
jgi:hypothetical protein